MKRYFLLLILTTIALLAIGQPGFAPFYHGVASGDPLIDKVIIWTRLTPSDTNMTYAVNWRMATDTAFNNVVSSGAFNTDKSRDFTVKVDAGGLQADTWYYYDFEYNGQYSIIGRTRTVPTGQVDQLRFAVVSCSDYPDGYFNAYARIGERNDLDAVIHLGDYIYESDNDRLPDRPPVPFKDLETLTDYRQRYAQHHTDLDLVYMRQQYPLIAIWDDHEFTGNAWQYGSENNDPDSLEFIPLKANAIKAYFEWIPIRQVDPNDTGRIYRDFQWGGLAELIMIDTRVEGRMQQVADLDSLTELNDTNRTLLGQAQFDWLSDQLVSSTAKWKILGNQVMMLPLLIGGAPINNDQWDGYPAERAKLFKLINDSSVNNLVVITGDFHRGGASNLPLDVNTYNDTTGIGSIAVEFITPSVASGIANEPIPPFSFIKAQDPYIQYADFERNGYTVIDLSASRATGEHYMLPTVTEITSDQELDGIHFTLDGGNRLFKDSVATTPPAVVIPQAPFGYRDSLNTSIRNHAEAFITGLYPNPAANELYMIFSQKEAGDVNVSIFNSLGKQVYQSREVNLQAGRNLHTIQLGGLASGTYILNIQSSNGDSFSKLFVIAE